jgi:hypothetical protein
MMLILLLEILFLQLMMYNTSLDQDHEVGIMLASFGQTVTVNITGIGYQGTKLIKFKGFLAATNTPVELLQHVSQLGFLID